MPAAATSTKSVGRLVGDRVVLGRRDDHPAVGGPGADDLAVAQPGQEAAEHRADRAGVVEAHRDRRLQGTGHGSKLEHVLCWKTRALRGWRHEAGSAAGVLGRTAARRVSASWSRAAEESGFDAVFTAEAWGSDAFTPLAWWGRETSRLRLGTSIVQMSGRTPTSIAMHALTLDHLSGGRVVLGHGRERPAGGRGVVRPAVRQAAGAHPRGRRHHPPGARPRGAGHQRRPALPAALPRRGLGRAGQAAQADRAPAAADIPIWLGAEGPKNVAQTAEIADGWLPIFYTPRSADMYRPWLDEGFARAGRTAYPRRLRDRRDLPPPGHRRQGAAS